MCEPTSASTPGCSHTVRTPLLLIVSQLTTQSNVAPLDFSPLRRLRILVVQAGMLWELPFIRSLLEAVERSPSRDTIEEIQIQLTRGILHAQDMKALGACDDWERVDAAIASLATCPHFCRVSFLLRCPSLHLAETGSSEVKARLPFSQAAGAVDFAFTGCRTMPGSEDGHQCEVIKSPRANSSKHVWL
jgi:hypothetical protein